MATVGHLAIGIAAGRLEARGRRDLVRSFVLYGALAALPDVDLIATVLGHPAALSHRGPTHSLLFAAAAAILVALWAPTLLPGHSRWSASLVAFLAVASHVLVDPLIAHSSGTEWLWPFSPARLLWGHFQPIPDAFSGFAWPFVSPVRLLGEAMLFSPFGAYALWPRRRATSRARSGARTPPPGVAAAARHSSRLRTPERV